MIKRLPMGPEGRSLFNDCRLDSSVFMWREEDADADGGIDVVVGGVVIGSRFGSWKNKSLD